MLPKIRFKYPWLLLNSFDFALRPVFEKEGNTDLLEKEFILERLERHEKAWLPYEQKVLQGMCDIFGLQFRQNVIDIYVAPLRHAFSDPLMISTKHSPDEVVNVIAHELMHRLLTDNLTYDDDLNGGLLTHWRLLFGSEHSNVTLAHIPVHAGLEMLFIDVLHEPQRLVNDIDRCQQFEAYRQAWEYVKASKYKNILTTLKAGYIDCQQKL